MVKWFERFPAYTRYVIIIEFFRNSIIDVGSSSDSQYISRWYRQDIIGSSVCWEQVLHSGNYNNDNR